MTVMDVVWQIIAGLVGIGIGALILAWIWRDDV
jgi:hypothetical protein